MLILYASFFHPSMAYPNPFLSYPLWYLLLNGYLRRCFDRKLYLRAWLQMETHLHLMWCQRFFKVHRRSASMTCFDDFHVKEQKGVLVMISLIIKKVFFYSNIQRQRKLLHNSKIIFTANLLLCSVHSILYTADRDTAKQIDGRNEKQS